jgi:hypothetical protein
MDDIIGELLACSAASVREPAGRDDIHAVCESMGAQLPSVLVRLWSASDGIDFEPLHCHIPGTAEILQMIDEKTWCDLAEAGWLPILDDHESNYLAICVRSPLAHRVVHLPHDDGPRLIYRDAASSFQQLLEHAERGETPDTYLFESPGDYPPDGSRTDDDRSVGKALLASEHRHTEWNFAAQLLDAADVPAWEHLLETDHFVRRDVRARLKQINNPVIQQLLARDQQAFDDFVALAAREAGRAGFKVGQRGNDSLQIGDKWMNMEAFFHRRRISNAIPRMMDWFRDLLDGHNPHDREGHFMED